MPSYPSLRGPEEIGQKTFGGNLDGCLTPRVSWEPIFAPGRGWQTCSAESLRIFHSGVFHSGVTHWVFSFLKVYNGASLVAQSVKNPPALQETQVRFLGRVDPLQEGTATHSSVLAWRIPWTEEPGGLQSMGLQELDMT